MPRPQLLLIPLALAALAALACDRPAEQGLHPFVDFGAAVESSLSTPLEATAGQRLHDAGHKRAWQAILDRLDALIGEIAEGRRFCLPASPAATSGPPQDLLDQEGFSRLRTRVEAECEGLMTDIAQLDPTGAASALFLPTRRLSRTIRTALISTLEISCPTPAILEARLESIRRQTKTLRQYLGSL